MIELLRETNIEILKAKRDLEYKVVTELTEIDSMRDKMIEEALTYVEKKIILSLEKLREERMELFEEEIDVLDRELELSNAIKLKKHLIESRSKEAQWIIEKVKKLKMELETKRRYNRIQLKNFKREVEEIKNSVLVKSVGRFRVSNGESNFIIKQGKLTRKPRIKIDDELKEIRLKRKEKAEIDKNKFSIIDNLDQNLYSAFRPKNLDRKKILKIDLDMDQMDNFIFDYDRKQEIYQMAEDYNTKSKNFWNNIEQQSMLTDISKIDKERSNELRGEIQEFIKNIKLKHMNPISKKIDRKPVFVNENKKTRSIFDPRAKNTSLSKIKSSILKRSGRYAAQSSSYVSRTIGTSVLETKDDTTSSDSHFKTESAINVGEMNRMLLGVKDRNSSSLKVLPISRRFANANLSIK